MQFLDETLKFYQDPQLNIEAAQAAVCKRLRSLWGIPETVVESRYVTPPRVLLPTPPPSTPPPNTALGTPSPNAPSCALLRRCCGGAPHLPSRQRIHEPPSLSTAFCNLQPPTTQLATSKTATCTPQTLNPNRMQQAAHGHELNPKP